MNIPLPRVVADVEAGGPFVTAAKGMNALKRQQLDNQIARAQADYAPFTTYADAASKLAYANMLPYQIQAQTMSNPMMWMALKDDPKALEAVMSNFKNSIPTGQNIFGNVNLPAPMTRQNPTNSIFGALMNKLMGGSNQQNTNPLAQMLGAQGSNALGNSFGAVNQATPAEVNNIANNGNGAPPLSNAKGFQVAPTGMDAIVSKAIKPYTQQIYDPAKTVTTDAGSFSIPSESQVSASQQAILGIKNLKPILEDISKGAEKWLSSGKKGQVKLGQVASLAEQYFGDLAGIPAGIMKAAGVTKKDISDYAEWQTQQKKAVETYMKARGWPQDELAIKKVSEIFEPVYGEGKEYGDRVARELAQLESQTLPNYQNQLKGGVPLNDQAQAPTIEKPQTDRKAWPINKSATNENEVQGQMAPEGTKWMIRPDGLKVPVHNSNKEIAKNKYHYRDA